MVKYISLVFLTIALVHCAQGFSFPVGGDQEDEEEHREKRMHPHESMAQRLPEDARTVRNDNIQDFEFWFDSAQSALRSKLGQRKIENQAKNVILFLGDGMSVPTITSARIFKGELEKLPFAEDAELSFDKFPYTGVSKTYCSDNQVADSACSATAYLCGTKTNKDMVGVRPTVQYRDCAAQMKPENHVSSILAWAQAVGMSTGIVTTTRVTHATPAGTYAHAADRDWENDSEVKDSGADPAVCDDIAEQLILNEPGRNINVILGGGRRDFFSKDESDIENGKAGKRRDGKNLINTWEQNNRNRSGVYVTGRYELLNLDTRNVDHLLGLFAPSHVEYLDEQAKKNDPSLSEMTQVAISILNKNAKGYFLLVEGGRIDQAHHDNNAQRALYETIEFDKAVQQAERMTNINDTLIVVTADHAHVMTLSGYPKRGNSVFGLAGISDVDGLPYTTLSYANGPGYKNPTSKGARYDISKDKIHDLEYQQPTTVPLESETHGGEDTLIFSKGPFAHLLTGVQQESFIPYVMGYAACIGPGEHFCDSITS